MLELNRMINEGKLYNDNEALDAIRLAIKKLKSTRSYKTDSYGATGSPTPEWVRTISEIEHILSNVRLMQKR